MELSDFGIPDELPVPPSDHALDVFVDSEGGISDFALATDDDGGEGAAIHAGGNRNTGQFAKRGEEVVHVGEGRGATVGDAGARKDAGGLEVFVEVLLAHEAMATADSEALVACEQNDGVGREGSEDAADVVVEAGDDGVVVGEVLPHVVGGAGEWGEEFVADLEVAIVKGVFREEVFGQRELGGVVHAGERSGRGARVVGDGRGHVDEEWLFAGGARPFDDLIGVAFGLKGAEVEGFLGIQLGLEGFAGREVGIAALAVMEGSVAGIFEGFGEEGCGRGELFAAGRDSEDGAAGHEHRAGGEAHGGDETALGVEVRENESAADKGVEVGGVDFGVVEGTDGVKALVVGIDEEDVGGRGSGEGG